MPGTVTRRSAVQHLDHVGHHHRTFADSVFPRVAHLCPVFRAQILGQEDQVPKRWLFCVGEVIRFPVQTKRVSIRWTHPPGFRWWRIPKPPKLIPIRCPIPPSVGVAIDRIHEFCVPLDHDPWYQNTARLTIPAFTDRRAQPRPYQGRADQPMILGFVLDVEVALWNTLGSARQAITTWTHVSFFSSTRMSHEKHELIVSVAYLDGEVGTVCRQC